MSGTSAPTCHTRVRVRYADTDQMGVAYYANYFVWFEMGRTEWLRAGGWSYHAMEQEGCVLPVLEAHCNYRHPARYDDELDIAACGTCLTPVRLRFHYEIRRMADQALLAEGHTVHAAVSSDGRLRRLPERVRELLG